jgi:hypothetical protein
MVSKVISLHDTFEYGVEGTQLVFMIHLNMVSKVPN